MKTHRFFFILLFGLLLAACGSEIETTRQTPAQIYDAAGLGSKPTAERPSAPPAAELSPSATSEPTPAAALVEVAFTLRTVFRDGKMLYEGVGGDIDGVINPTLNVAPGTVVRAILVNGDGMTHNLYFPDFKAKMAEIGRREQTAEATFTVSADQAGTYVYYCTLPGHREAGQEGQLVVAW